MRYIFTLLNGNRNHTQYNSNACHHPCCTSEPSLPNSASPWKWLFQSGDCYSQNYTVLCTNTTRKHVRAFFQRTKKTAGPHAFSCCCQFQGIMIRSFMIVCAAILYQTSCQNTKKCHHTAPENCVMILKTVCCCLTIKHFYNLTKQPHGNLQSCHCSLNKKGILNFYILNQKQLIAFNFTLQKLGQPDCLTCILDLTC